VTPPPTDRPDSPQPTGLGAAPTLSKAESEGRAGADSAARRTPGRRRRPGPGLGTLVVLVVVVVFALVPLVGSALKKTPRDRVGISYGGGPIEGARFQKIVEPGSALFFNGLFDPLYLYPADQQNYIISRSAGQSDDSASDSVIAPSKDRVAIEYQVAVYYKLNTDKLRSFHEELGLKYQAFTTKGWNNLIRDTFRQQIENALQEQTRRYGVADVYGNADLLVTVQSEVQRTLSERLKAALGDQFFCAPTFRPGGACEDPTFIIKRADIPESVAAAYESNRTSQVLVTTRENEVLQREQEARGIEALAGALQQAGPAYVLMKAIESGKIDFWVLPSDGNVTLATPDGEAGSPTPSPGG
jgi:hypothetical protein